MTSAIEQKSLTKFKLLFSYRKNFFEQNERSYKLRETPEGFFYDKNVLKQNIPKRVKMK